MQYHFCGRLNVTYETEVFLLQVARVYWSASASFQSLVLRVS